MSEQAPVDTQRRLEQLDDLIDLGRAAQAKERVESLLASAPDDAVLRCVLGRAELVLGNPTSALAAARSAAPALPDEPLPFRLAALAHRALGRPEEARASALEAVRRAPDQALGHLALAQVSLGYDSQLALQAALQAVELAPESADAHYVVGLAAEWNGDYRTGEQAYRRVLQLQPGHASAQNNLGVRALERGSPVVALRHFADAAAVNPAHAVARQNVDAPITRWLMTGVLVVGVLALFSMVQGDARLTGTIAFVAGLAVVAGYVRVRLARRVRRLLWSYPRRHRGLAAGALAAGLLFCAAAAASPFSRGVSLLLGCLTAAVALATLVAHRIGRTRRQR